MKTFEIYCKELLSNRNNVIKLLIGFIVGLFPIANIACLGYIMQTVNKNSESDNTLPPWTLSQTNVVSLYKDGLTGLILLTIFFGGPILLFYVLGMCFAWLGHGFISLGTCLGIMLGAQMTSIAFLYNNYAMQSKFWKLIKTVFNTTLKTISIFIFPALLFLGLQLAGMKILHVACSGAIMFLGLILIVSFAKQEISINPQSSPINTEDATDTITE